MTDKVGSVVSACKVRDEDQVLLITNQGQTIRMKAMDVSVIGRNTQGVRLMNLKEEEESITEMTVMSSSEKDLDIDET